MTGRRTPAQERDLHVADILNDLALLRERPSQLSAATVRRVAADAQEAMRALLCDVQGWERRAAVTEEADR